ncbi:MAG: dipeptidyl-peptidase 4 [Algoriphagus marincola HL-49]|uniref:Dipeptidyl-peptidase 4 n=1 Tax=Algoriphagus marincola HL-49 TaxID=1305737 RepID=A0A0P7XDJ6_9BACT|nr:MAG: dipeptidyl-peptidase 4 [Algoriphagus marincola HL-49]
MRKFNPTFSRFVFVLLILLTGSLKAKELKWSSSGESIYQIKANGITEYSISDQSETVVVPNEWLTPNGEEPLSIRDFSFYAEGQKLLIYTNTKRVWRLDTQGDYWVLDMESKKLQQIGKGLPESSLRFAKLSPDGQKAAYVSEYNLYVEDLNSGEITALTTDGNRKLINGTFDWAYEEEFACRDGFQWSPDSKQIAYWRLDANQIRDFYMINNSDSVYSQIIPVEYPKVGESPSPAKIGVVDLSSQKTTWLNIPGDPAQHYLPRMEWNNPDLLLVQQLNRKQNHSKIYAVNVPQNQAEVIHEEKDEAWIDVMSTWDNVYSLTYRHRFPWVSEGKEFVWLSEKDGWRHVYRMGLDGKEQLVTRGEYDVINLLHVDETEGWVYFHASPDNATQKYLYRTRWDGSGEAEMLTPPIWEGTHDYQISPSGKFALYRGQNHYTRPVTDWISLPDHDFLSMGEQMGVSVNKPDDTGMEFFTVTLEDGTEMDGWMVKPSNFDPTKKYPVVFYVYTEPWGANVKDTYGVGRNRLYDGDMAEDGYIYISLDNRGTPAPKGRAWRKSIYRKIGRLNISDQAEAAKQILEWDYVDPDRIAVWGWSGGGSATLNLLFQYPEIYKTGISIAAVANQLTYDNIYQERYMGLPQENLEDFIAGSPITHAKNLEGNLLYIHGTADDNVHYANADMLVNELIKHGKIFQFMPYPNRSHSISEGMGTNAHLRKLYTDYLKKHCPPGAK